MLRVSQKDFDALNRLSKFCFEIASAAGWWGNEFTNKLDRNKGELIALMHSELSEALEGVRKDIQDDHLPHRKNEEVELADAIIRILDYCGAFNLDIGGAIKEKIEYNIKRTDHKLNNRIKIGGKKF